MATRWFIGLASSSSGLGVNAALVEIQGIGLDLTVKLVHAIHQPHPPEVRNLIRRVNASFHQADLKQFYLLHRILGETLANAARQVADRASFSLSKVMCVGCSDHSLCHEPEGRFPSTVGLGMEAIVAEKTGITAVSDFRSRDLAVSGQGEPITALADFLMFHDPNENRVLVHLGSAAGLIYLPAQARLQEIIGWEASPCNLLLDGLIVRLTGGKEEFDPGGKHAVQGRCDESLLQRWLAHPYLQRRPPKSWPRNIHEMIEPALQAAKQSQCTLNDLLCTANHFVARSIADSVRRFLPREDRLTLYLSGGSVRNGLLWHLLEQQLDGVAIEKINRTGIPGDARKAMAIAVLAALSVDGVPGNLPSATGASAARLLGRLTPGSSANWSRCLNWMAAQQIALPRSWAA